MFFAALFTILGHESNLDVHQQINEYRSYSTYTHEILLNYKKELVWVSSNEVGEPRTFYIEWS